MTNMSLTLKIFRFFNFVFSNTEMKVCGSYINRQKTCSW